MEDAHKAITVNDIVDRFIEYCESDYKSDHPANLRAGLKKLQQHSGNMAASDFRGLALIKFREALVRGDLSQDVLSRDYINRIVKYVKQCWKWAVARELLPPEALTAIETVEPLREGRTDAPETDPVEPVEPERVRAILPYLSGSIRDMVELMLLTGARTIEVRTMVQREIDMSRDDVWVYRPRKHKTSHKGKLRAIPLDEPCQRILMPRMKPFLPDSVVFPSPKTGRVYGKDSVYNAVQRACARAKVERFHPHQIRHHTLTVVRGLTTGDLDAAQGLAGHSSRSTTEGYAPIDIEAAIRGQQALRRSEGA